MPTQTRMDVQTLVATEAQALQAATEAQALQDAERDENALCAPKDAKARAEAVNRAIHVPTLLLEWLQKQPQHRQFSKDQKSATFILKMFLATTERIECEVFANYARITGTEETVHWPYWAREFCRSLNREGLGGMGLVCDYVETLSEIVEECDSRAGRRPPRGELHTDFEAKEAIHRHMD